MKRFFVCFLIAVTCMIAAAQQPPKNENKPTYIRAGRLFDATSDTMRENVVIVVLGGRIQSVVPASSASIPSGATVIDLSRATVLPGLIDCHTHLGARADRYDEIYRFKDTPFSHAFAAVVNARKTLEAGFTSVRDVGSLPFLAVDLRNSINEGLVPGPRMVASGPGISITGGHGDLNNYSPQTRVNMFPDERNFGIADGPDQVRHVVRAQVKYGVDVIKILATGGVLSKGDSPGAPQFTLEELRVAAEEAHMAGRKIAAHAHGAQGIKNAILAGIDSIEHASLIDDEGIRLAKERGVYLVMDIYNDDYLLNKAAEFGLPKENIEKERMVGQLQRDNFQRAVRAGVKMAFGTDAGVYPHGDNAKQFFYMVKYGMTPAQAIRAATSSAADLIGRAKDVGTVEPGKFADLIAVSADPLQDVRALENVSWVMKGGVVYKDTITTKPAR
ncbi:MAG TPA: amidohydrolase family protein [Terriglobales bacterium]|jgi:imidazolonepropionase-like amidohydrolase|nr:amidohydrolase family protein [Terriglobales bacterium]